MIVGWLRRHLAIVILVVLGLVMLAGVIAWSVAIWAECRAVHSWLYCLRVVVR